MAKARWFEESDRPAAQTALAAHRERLVSIGRDWAPFIGTDAAQLVDRLVGNYPVVIIGDYLVAFEIAVSWLTPNVLFFDEVLVLRITQHVGNSMRNVVQEMERIARLNDCVGVQVGTFGAIDERLSKVYQRLGFKVSPVLLHKEF